MEDESGRIRLDGVIAEIAHSFVTGVAVGVKGYVTTVGTFTVNELILLGDNLLYTCLNTTLTTPISIPQFKGSNKYILFVSGLKFGAAVTPSNLFSAQMLADFVTGRLSSPEDSSGSPSGVIRVVVAGNSVVEATALSKDKAVSAKQQAAAAIPLDHFDMFLAQLLVNCPVEVIPGETDPCSINYPQQPLRSCLLPRATRFKNNLHLATNPYESKITFEEGRSVCLMGHSGKPLDDIALQTTSSATPVEAMDVSSGPETESSVEPSPSENCNDSPKNYLTMLENTLKWGNLCPTAPDSLPCYPVVEQDPFVLSYGEMTTPDIVFAGNTPAYASSLYESKDQTHKTRVLCVPAFYKSKQAVLVNVDTLESHILQFN